MRVLNNSDGTFFVVECGLKPGARIVTEGVATLGEGATKPRPVNSLVG